MAELGLVPVPQARFLHAIGDTMAVAVGPSRRPWLYRHGSFLDAGTGVPASSDRPVAPGAPLHGVQSAVERTSSGGELLGADERVTAEQALRAGTADAAWAAGDKDRRGRVAPDMLADLVLLGDDPVTVDSAEVGRMPVLATFLGGECVHGAERLTASGPLGPRS